jgi:NAD(P)-dependent dehydrogenase (short-subunit alcohol dehydrogenase family)
MKVRMSTVTEQALRGRLANKVAIVTGAGGGIGAAIARVFAREGARLVLTDIDDAAARQVANTLAIDGPAPLVLAHDASDEAAWAAVIAGAVAAHGRIDVVVNNAGVSLRRSVEDTTLADWHRLRAANCDSAFLGTRAAVAAMKSGRPPGGSIVNVGSIAALVGDPQFAAYGAAKAGVDALTRAAALHCAQAGYRIRVNAVHPGFIETPMLAREIAATGMPGAARRVIERLHPLGHVGEPDDVAFAALYLASDEAKFVTGTALVVDGGYTAQ